MRDRLPALLVLLALVLAACSGDSDDASPTPDPTAAPSATPADTIEVEPTEEPEPTPTPTPVPEPGVLSVDDTDVVGTVGDDLLSLVEAVRVANGSLAVAELSAGEAARVTGEPGREMADTITVEPDELQAPGGNFWIVEMLGNDGDVVDGNDTRIVRSGDDQEARNLFFVASSDVTVRGFTFDGMQVAVAVESVGEAIEGIVIEGNAFAETRFEDIVVRNTISGGSISGVTITGNSFTNDGGGFTVHRFVSVFGALPGGADVTDTSIADLTISGNAMTSAEGFTATCIAVHGGGLMLSSSAGAIGSTVEGVTIADNVLTGCSVGIELNGGASLQQSGTVEGAALSGVSIAGTVLGGFDTAIAIRGGASTLVADFEPEPAAAILRENNVTGVSVSDTTIQGFAVGLDVAGGLADFETDSVTANTVGELTLATLNFVEVATPCTVRADVGQGASDNTADASCDGASADAGG